MKADRQAFEEWITEWPYERSVERVPKGSDKYIWPGQYENTVTQIAWEAWCEGCKQKVDG